MTALLLDPDTREMIEAADTMPEKVLDEVEPCKIRNVVIIVGFAAECALTSALVGLAAAAIFAETARSLEAKN